MTPTAIQSDGWDRIRQPNMTKNVNFLIAVALIAIALFALRFCYPHSGAFDRQEHADPK
jgi:hypothetical protein